MTPKPIKSSLPVKIKKVHITGLDGFNENDLLLAFKAAGVNYNPNNVDMFHDFSIKGWEFHYADDNFTTGAAEKRYNDLLDKSIDGEFENETDKFKARFEEVYYYPGDVLGYGKVQGMAEYYVFKRGGKYYTLCSNKFEYSEWFMGGDFEVLSDIHKFNDITSAMNFVVKDAPKLKKSTMTGHIGGGGSYDVEQLKEANYMTPKPTKNKSSLPVKLKQVHITGLEGFDENDLLSAFKAAGINYNPNNRDMFHDFWIKGWEFHYVDDGFATGAAEKRYYDLLDRVADGEFENETDKFKARFKEKYYYPGEVLGYGKVKGMGEYYVFKRGGKYYTLCANQFEYSEWFLGGDFEVFSDIHKFNDITSAMKFIIQDAPKLTRSTMTGAIDYDIKQLKEAEISSYDADDIFAKHGVKGASLMNPEQLKAAYKKLAVKHHPDRGGNTEVMKDINAAYDSLKGGGGGTGADADEPRNARSSRTRSEDPEDPTAMRELNNLSDYLEGKLDKNTYMFDGRIDFTLMDFLGGMLSITIIAEGWVRQVHIFKRGNKFKVSNAGDDELKEFSITDKDGIFNFLDTLIKRKTPKKLK